MHATFFVNSGFVEDSAHMTWEQLRALAAAGNEIAGHTLNPVDLKPMAVWNKLKPLIPADTFPNTRNCEA
jgi:Polysaccharide deacetylase